MVNKKKKPRTILPGLTILDAVKKDDGSADASFYVTKEFEEWFTKLFDINEFNSEIFVKFIEFSAAGRTPEDFNRWLVARESYDVPQQNSAE
jgi:hypothetical protein